MLWSGFREIALFIVEGGLGKSNTKVGVTVKRLKQPIRGDLVCVWYMVMILNKWMSKAGSLMCSPLALGSHVYPPGRLSWLTL
jgi:hypothetical protein